MHLDGLSMSVIFARTIDLSDARGEAFHRVPTYRPVRRFSSHVRPVSSCWWCETRAHRGSAVPATETSSVRGDWLRLLFADRWGNCHPTHCACPRTPTSNGHRPSPPPRAVVRAASCARLSSTGRRAGG